MDAACKEERHLTEAYTEAQEDCAVPKSSANLEVLLKHKRIWQSDEKVGNARHSLGPRLTEERLQ